MARPCPHLPITSSPMMPGTWCTFSGPFRRTAIAKRMKFFGAQEARFPALRRISHVIPVIGFVRKDVLRSVRGAPSLELRLIFASRVAALLTAQHDRAPHPPHPACDKRLAHRRLDELPIQGGVSYRRPINYNLMIDVVCSL